MGKKMKLGVIGKSAVYIVLLLLALCVGYVISMSGVFHTPTSFHEFDNSRPAQKRVLVVGGTSGTGLEVVRKIHERGDAVSAIVRQTSNTGALDQLGVETLVADAMDAASLAAVITPQRFDALVSTMGTSTRDLPARKNFVTSLIQGQTKMEPGKRPDYIGNRNVFDAAAAADIKRIVFVTVIGPGKSVAGLPVMARRGHQEVVPLKEKAEIHLRNSGAQYTIIRPGGLSNGPMTNTARLTEDAASFSFMGRQDLARLIVDSLYDDSTIGKTFTAYDPNRLFLWNLFLD
jgi:uncharacterized protein YbjT (DUF2867 family)